MPKVSIVLPNYNYARYLDERIQSLLNQTYTDFELIIIDDGSTDNSLEVIKKYTNDRRVRTKFYTGNSGLCYKRWNDGAELARGEHLLFAGSDDYCHPTLLEKLVERLEGCSSCGLAYSQSWEVDSQGRILRSMKAWTDDLSKEHWAKDYINSGKEECRYLFFKNTIPNASAVLMRRKLFMEAGGFNLQIKLCADWMLYAKSLLISDIAFIAEGLNYFRKHPQTIRNRYLRDATNIEDIYKIISYLNKHIQVSKDVYEKVCNRIAGQWAKRIIDKSERIPLSRHGRIYKAARQADSRIKGRILRKVLLRLIKRMFGRT